LYRLRYTPEAIKDIKKLDTVTRKRLDKKLRYFASQEDPLRLAKPLVDYHDARFRYRVGMYRILFDLEGESIIVLRVDKRSDIYRMFMF